MPGEASDSPPAANGEKESGSETAGSLLGSTNGSLPGAVPNGSALAGPRTRHKVVSEGHNGHTPHYEVLPRKFEMR